MPRSGPPKIPSGPIEEPLGPSVRQPPTLSEEWDKIKPRGGNPNDPSTPPPPNEYDPNWSRWQKIKWTISRWINFLPGGSGDVIIVVTPPEVIRRYLKLDRDSGPSSQVEIKVLPKNDETDSLNRKESLVGVSHVIPSANNTNDNENAKKYNGQQGVKR